VFLVGQACPIPKGWNPASPKIFGTPYPRPNSLTWSDEIRCDNTCGGVACIYGVSHTPLSMGWGPSSTRIFWTFYLCTHSMRNNDQILYNKQICEEDFLDFLHGRQRMMTRDLFVVAKFLVLYLVFHP